MPSKPRAVASEILERQGLGELHGLNIFSTIMAVDDTFGPYDFLVRDAVLVIASVRTMHHEAPYAVWPELEVVRRRREPVGAPPIAPSG